MKVVLVRHGEAGPHAGDDAARALTGRGWLQARSTAEWLRGELGTTTGVRLLASPYQRAQETAQVLAELLGTPVCTVAAITPDDDPRVALAAIEEAGAGADVLVVVSHMPLVAVLATWLTAGTLGSGRGFGLAEARVLEAELAGPGLATERAVHVPGVTG